VDGLDVVELGCGTAYVSAWLARRGARPVGVDVTPAQLATARRCQRRSGFEVIDLVEPYAPDDAIDHSYYDTFSVEWSRKWPSEEIWVAEKRS
jgi:2-polyprenyl-3-methyl-5-hydroxy-6-metoxy-1,4-benzoquinol methylase